MTRTGHLDGKQTVQSKLDEVSYKRAVYLIQNCYENGDPEGAYQGALEELDKVARGKRDADWHYLRGYCFYETEEMESAEPEFREALRAQPDHFWAGLYLGHVLFDRGAYALALQHFIRVDEARLRRLDQHWRIAKNRELILCCRLSGPGRLPALKTMEPVILAYDSDPIGAPVPLEIVLCLDRLTRQGRLKGKTLSRWFESLEDLVACSGHSQSSSLYAPLTRLREAARRVVSSASRQAEPPPLSNIGSA